MLRGRARGAGGDSADARFEALAEDLARGDRCRDLLTEAGLAPQATELTPAWVLWQYFAAIAALIGGDVASGAPLAELGEAIDGEKVLTPDGAETTLVKAAEYVGFASTNDVLIALRACGALSVGVNGDVAAEALLVKAAIRCGHVEAVQ